MLRGGLASAGGSGGGGSRVGRGISKGLETVLGTARYGFLRDLVSQYFVAPIQYSAYEHFFFRFLTVLMTFRNLNLPCPQEHPYPNGIAMLFDLTWSCNPTTHKVLRYIFLLCGLLYTAKRGTTLVIGLMSIIHLMDATAKNSDGSIGHSNQMMTLVLWTQFLTYLYNYWLSRRTQHKDKEESSTASQGNSSGVSSMFTRLAGDSCFEDNMAIHFSHQVMGAVYMISAFTKLQGALSKSGEVWFGDKNLVLHIVKSNEEKYYSGTATNFEENLLANWLVHWMIRSRLAGAIFFGGAFFLELLAPIFIYNRLALLIGGLGFWGLHTGINLTMQLTFFAYKCFLAIYFMNFPYWITTAWRLWKTGGWRRLRWRDPSNNSPSPALLLPGNKAGMSTMNSLQGLLLGQKQHVQSRFFNRFPLWPTVALVLICLVSKDSFYPFSHFPMYAAPGNSTHYFQITNAQDEPLFMYPTLKCQASQVKKYFVTTTKQLQASLKTYPPLELVGNQTISFFYNAAPPRLQKKLEKQKPLKLWLIKLTLEDDAIKKTTRVVGLLP